MIASENLDADFDINIPDEPLLPTISELPPTSVAITGFPRAIDSKIAFEKPLHWLIIQKYHSVDVIIYINFFT